MDFNNEQHSHNEIDVIDNFAEKKDYFLQTSEENKTSKKISILSFFSTILTYSYIGFSLYAVAYPLVISNNDILNPFISLDPKYTQPLMFFSFINLVLVTLIFVLYMSKIKIKKFELILKYLSQLIGILILLIFSITLHNW